tara:strand:- start:152 stop:1957 length:1806 start_codon:yes stop_codon:yes gene_type:complete
MALTKIDDRGLKTPIDLLDNEKLRLGTGSDLQIFHNGGTGNNNISNVSGNLYINATETEVGILIKPNNAVELYYNANKKFETTSTGATVTGNLAFGDNGKASFGASEDLQIFHDGANSLIDETGTGILGLRSDTGINFYKKSNNEFLLKAIPDGAVELYHDNVKRFETTSTGTLTTGVLKVNDATSASNGNRIAVGLSEDIKIYHIAGNDSYFRNSTGDTYLQGNNSGTVVNNIKFENSNGATELYFNGSKKFETMSTGAYVEGYLAFPDNGGLKIGSGNDLQIYHDGSNSYINDTGTGSLILDGNDIIRLRLNGTTKFQTDSNGVIASGTEHRFTSGTSGNCKLIIEADTDNNDEDDNPLLIFRQDGGLDCSAIGMGETGTTSDNVLTIANSVSNGGIGFATGTTNGFTNAVERMFLRTDGLLVINHGHSKIINESGLAVRSGGNTCVFKAEGASGHNPIITWNNHSSGTRQQIQFGDGSSFGSRGSITTNGANVTYGGTSDYRKKQDDVSITDGIEKIKLLKPKRFKWKDALDLGICDGFFAHEVQAVAPTSQAVIGTKDEVDSDGNPVYQQMDQSKLIPLLVAAVQELITKVETLEAA